MKTALIISGGSFEKEFGLRFLCLLREKSTELYIIAADSGMAHCRALDLVPDCIVGDFDSCDPEDLGFFEDIKARAGTAMSAPESETAGMAAEMNVLNSGAAAADTAMRDPGSAARAVTARPEIRVYPPEKDWTDTELALHIAAEKGCVSVYILGGTGSRMDHVLGNISLLPVAADLRMECVLVDPKNYIYLREHPFRIRKEEQRGTYISLFAYGGPVEGLTIRGTKYQLTDHVLACEGSLCVSNRITEEEARISFSKGRLLVMETRD